MITYIPYIHLYTHSNVDMKQNKSFKNKRGLLDFRPNSLSTLFHRRVDPLLGPWLRPQWTAVGFKQKLWSKTWPGVQLVNLEKYRPTWKVSDHRSWMLWRCRSVGVGVSVYGCWSFVTLWCTTDLLMVSIASHLMTAGINSVSLLIQKGKVYCCNIKWEIFMNTEGFVLPGSSRSDDGTYIISRYHSWALSGWNLKDNSSTSEERRCSFTVTVVNKHHNQSSF